MSYTNLNLKKIPNYGFQFALSNLGELSHSFWKITAISVVGCLLSFYGTFLLSELISGLTSTSYDQIAYFYIPVFLLTYCGREFFEYFTRRDGEPFSTIAGNRFNQIFFAAILKSNPLVLSNVNKEELLASSSRYLGNATAFLSDWVWNISRKITQFIIVFMILGSQSIYICIGTMLYLILFLLFALNLSNRFYPFAKSVAEKGLAASSQLTQSYLALAIIRRLQLENFFLGKLKLKIEEQTHSVLTAQRFHAKRWLLQLNVFNILYMSTLFLGIYQVKDGRLELGFLLLIRYAFERLWEILVFIIEKYVALIQEKQETLILRKLLEPLTDQSEDLNSSQTISKFEKIEIQNLLVSLVNTKQDNNFDLVVSKLEIRLGDRFSLRAASGAGKTTFLLSLMHLIPFKGTIKFDSKSNQEFSIAPGLISYISPSEPLFPLSIEENITLGRSYSPDTLNAVINGLGINKFVDNQKVMIGQAGVNLSLGQTQRIRLARGLIARSSLLLLDEPFTGLDIESRELIKTFILDWCKDSSIILASHNEDDSLLNSKQLCIENGKLLSQNCVL